MSMIKFGKVEYPKLRPAFLAALIPTAVAINFAGTAIRQGLGVPLFLDSGGTILVSFIAGPWYGALCALLNAIVRSLLINPISILNWFGTLAVALLYGYSARYGITRTWTGLALTVIITAPITSFVSAFTAVFFLGGFTGSPVDIMASVFMKTTGRVLTGKFISDIMTTLVDKAVLVTLVMAILRALPSQYRALTPVASKTEEETLDL